MRLNHLDLHVPDIAATADFLIRHFGLTLIDMRGSNGLAILSDGVGLELVLSHPVPKFGGTDQVSRHAVSYHIGFIVDDRDEVDRVHAALRDDGAELLGEPRDMRGGWAFYCIAPGNILVEISARPLLVG